MRPDKRKLDELREIEFITEYTMHADGSVLAICGNTKVLCTAIVSAGVPRFLKGKGSGWLTAEYAMLPSSTNSRIDRERFKLKGRTYEIQRLIGRALRGIIDLEKLGERTITIDADVIQADGGTRTTAINGCCLALQIAVNKMMAANALKENPLIENIAAISVGLVNDSFRLDLMYEEDSAAQVDMNVVMTESGEYVEIQGTGEGRNYSRDELNKMLDLADKGIKEIIEKQKAIIS